MLQRWSTLTFLHWAYDPPDVQRLLPEGLAVETFDGAAWVGLVPFHMTVWPPALGGSRVASRFPETNVRTYVKGPDGRTGILFFSLDAGSLAPVLAARATWWLPYMWSTMSIEGNGTRSFVYTCRRRWPGPSAKSRVGVELGSPLAEAEVGAFERYLTARFRLYTKVAGVLIETHAEHPPWRLRRAVATELDDELVEAIGLPRPREAPLAHFSEGVDVRIGRVRTARS